MCTERPALGQRIAELVELGAIEFRPDPLDAIVERRLKAIWAARSCPHCEQNTPQVLDGSDRIWYSRCNWKTTYTRETPFYDSEPAPGEFLIAFILYADTFLSINQIAYLLSPSYKTLRENIRAFETAFFQGFSDCLGAHLPDSRWTNTGR